MTDMADDRAWMHRREGNPCTTTDPELFFPEDGADTRAAIEVCQDCRNIGKCLRYAVNNAISVGVWGGVSATDRRVLIRAAGTGGHRRLRPNRVDPGPWRGCDVEGCGNQHVAGGLCKSHYQKAWRARKVAA